MPRVSSEHVPTYMTLTSSSSTSLRAAARAWSELHLQIVKDNLQSLVLKCPLFVDIANRPLYDALHGESISGAVTGQGVDRSYAEHLYFRPATRSNDKKQDRRDHRRHDKICVWV